MPHSLVVLDFSGTLSLGAVLCGRRTELEAELRATGLARLVAGDVDAFWSRIVGPTWEEGSTTAVGYVGVLTERLLALAAEAGVPAGEGEVAAAASCFVGRYLARSAIDPAWRPLLVRLQGLPEVRTVVATDHYAEATPHVVGQLEAWSIRAVPVLEAGPSDVVVANSADLGHHKATAAFWESVRRALDVQVSAVYLVDDFGAHEESSDPYAARDRVARRRQRTVGALQGAFGAPVEALAFDLGAIPGEPGTDATLTRRYRRLVRRVGAALLRALEGACPP